jgi:hypothetical protein
VALPLLELSRCSRTNNVLMVGYNEIRISNAILEAWTTQILISHLIIGKPVSHQFAKEVLAGFAGAEVDKLAETKGEDFFDRERSKHEAKKQAEHLYDQHYGGQDQYDP